MSDRFSAADRAVRVAIKRYHVADAALDRGLKAALAVGREISWEHGDYVRWSEVTDIYGRRVKVRGASGREYWIDCWRVREIMPSEPEVEK